VRGYINFYRRIHRRNMPSVIPSANLSVNRTRHHMVLPFWIRRWFRRPLHRWIGHATVRSWRFESLGASIGISIGDSVTSPYGDDVLNPSVIPSVKIPAITSTSANHPLFLNSQHSVRNFIGKYRRMCAVGIYRWNYGRSKVCR